MRDNFVLMGLVKQSPHRYQVKWKLFEPDGQFDDRLRLPATCHAKHAILGNAVNQAKAAAAACRRKVIVWVEDIETGRTLTEFTGDGRRNVTTDNQRKRQPSFWQDDKGQDLVEYSLLLAFIALAALALMSSAGGSVKTIWSRVSSELTSVAAES